MAKVRYSKRCAGTCGKMLPHGSQAFRLHGTLWCFACALEHKRTCVQFATHSA